MKKVYAREEYCLGCKLCEVYCVTAHSQSNDIIKAHKNENISSRIVIETDDNISFAMQCRHCEDAPCTKACITGAMQKDPETGIVNYDQDKCVGCWTCIMSCPYGAIKRDEFGRNVISKCDLCTEKLAEDEEPACVTHCPNQALVYKEIESAKGLKEKELKKEGV